jgi:hypothetical protein
MRGQSGSSHIVVGDVGGMATNSNRSPRMSQNSSYQTMPNNEGKQISQNKEEKIAHGFEDFDDDELQMSLDDELALAESMLNEI